MSMTDGQVEVVRGDITRQRVDAIVNAANSSLLGGGGVDGAIHRVAGPELLEVCRRIGGCPPGEARITAGFRLPARWVIHTVGPIWRGGGSGEDETLARCYRSAFAIARERGLTSIAFPSISTGIYGFPLQRAVPIALRELRTGQEQNPDLEVVRVVCHGDDTYRAYARGLELEMD